MITTRRSALTVLGSLLTYYYGRPAQGRPPNSATLILDTMEGGIFVQYRGTVVRVTPAEIMKALLSGEPDESARV